MTISRDVYGAINETSVAKRTMKIIRNLVDGICKADHIDEHGGWSFGIEKITSKRSRALNWSTYGYGKDLHSGRMLAVIQVREWTEGRRWNTVRKSYFLIGRNEDNTVFAHPVQAQVIHAAVKKSSNPSDIVKAVQKWIFEVDYERVLRQGDVAVIPSRMPARNKAEVLDRDQVTLEDSHVLQADAFMMNGSLYALNPSMDHLPATHPHVEAKGWCKIVVGQRGNFWNFATPTVD